MPDATPRSPSPSVAPPAEPKESIKDRLGEAARRRASRPRAILVLYAVLALTAVVIFVGQLAGWWPSSVANKVLERRKAAEAPKPVPDPAMSDLGPGGSR